MTSRTRARERGPHWRLGLATAGLCAVALMLGAAPRDPGTPANPTNVARGGRATQSSLAYGGAPDRAIDGNMDGDYMRGSVTHTAAEAGAWWQVDLGAVHRVDRVVIWNRADCCGERLAGFTVTVAVAPPGTEGEAPWVSPRVDRAERRTEIPVGRAGRYVRVQLTATNYLSLAEVEVLGSRQLEDRGNAAGGPDTQAPDAVTVPVRPSTSPQVVPFRDLLRVTIPGGLLQAPDTLTILPIHSAPRGIRPLSSVPAYEVSLDGLHELPAPVTIDFAYEPERMPTGFEGKAEPLGAYWDTEHRLPRFLFTSWDPGGRRATVATTHLTPFLLTGAEVVEPYHARMLTWGEWSAAQHAAGAPVSAGVDTPTDHVLVTTHFAHNFREDEVERLAAAWMEPPPLWPGRNVPRLVEATERYLQTALSSYGVVAAQMPRPRVGQLPVSYVPNAAPAAYDHRADLIRVDTGRDRRPTPTLHKVRVAHELFHSLQNRWLGGGEAGGLKCAQVGGVHPPGFWWIEAAAEVASCRVAFSLPHMMARSVDDIYPYLLEYPLTRPGFAENTHAMTRPDDFGPWDGEAELEYQRAHFLAYLMDHGADFLEMNRAVMDYYRDHDGVEAIFTPLDRYVTGLPGGTSLPRAYRRFAAWFLLSEQSPLGVRNGPQSPRISVVRTVSGQERQADRLAGVLDQTFDLEAPFTAKMWAVQADPARFTPTAGAPAPPTARQVKVTAVSLQPNQGVQAQVFVAQDNTRLPNDPAPPLTLGTTGASGALALGPDQTLYVVATNTDLAQAGRAVVRVEDITTPPPPPAPPQGSPPATGPTPPAPASGTRLGCWRLIDSRATRYETPPNDASVVESSFTVDEGAISGRLTTDSHVGEGPATWAGGCSWTWQSAGGLERLVPDDTVELSMTAIDESVPEKLSGWNHGMTGVSGSIRFDAPFLGLGVTHHAAVDLVNVRAAWNGTDTQRGSWSVPAGPGHPEWGGRASLVAACAFGKLERVYEWVGDGGPGRAAAAPTPFNLGFVWHVRQWIGSDTWTWTWTRRVDSQTFDGVARNDQTGIESRHEIHFVSEQDGQVVLWRPDANGRYIGTLSPDKNRVVGGTMDSVGGDQGWTAEIVR